MANGILPETAVVLYLRMSSDGQEKSIPSQRAELTAYARSKGCRIVREYVDEAISGDETERRTGFLTMRDDAGSGEFSVVLCWDQHRFGRFDPLDAGFWIYPFRRAGVRLETIAQGKIDWEDLTGQLVYSVNQLGKAQFLRDLSRNTTRGLLASAREGTAGTGGPEPYGYGSRDGKVWIVEDEAKVVRLIFTSCVKPGGSLRGIAADLNRSKTPPPRGKVWRCSSVRAILTRRKYTGAFVYGARNSGKYFSWRDGEIIPRRKSDLVSASAETAGERWGVSPGPERRSIVVAHTIKPARPRATPTGSRRLPSLRVSSARFKSGTCHRRLSTASAGLLGRSKTRRDLDRGTWLASGGRSRSSTGRSTRGPSGS